MVTFAPEERDIQPANTAFWARPIQQPKSDVSAEVIGKGLGTAIAEGSRAIDEFVKQGVIKPMEEKDLGARRDAFADALNSARSYIEAPSSKEDQPKLMPGGENMPNAVANVGNRLEVIQNSMAGGHISETKYMGDIDNYLRRMRTMFPGYRDYIDQEAFRITGVHEANGYIRSQISDLNRMVSEHQTERNKVETRLYDYISKGIVTGDEAKRYNELIANNKLTPAMLDAELAQRLYEEGNIKRKTEAYKLGEQDRTVAGEKALDAFNTKGHAAVDQLMRFTKVNEFGKESPQSFIEGWTPGSIPSEQIAAAASVMRAKRAGIDAALDAAANAPQGDQPSWKNAISRGKGDTAYEESKKSIMQPLDDFIKALDDKEVGLAYLTKHQYEAIENDVRLAQDRDDIRKGRKAARTGDRQTGWRRLLRNQQLRAGRGYPGQEAGIRRTESRTGVF